MVRISLVSSLASLAPGALAALGSPDYPFTDPEFLLALEESESVGGESGWSPAHLAAKGADGRLLGLMPAFAKAHSYGEYVFDWEWARFYQRQGAAYYPKLVAAIPFTPATGPRLLIAADAARAEVQSALVAAAAQLTGSSGMSSCHVLFPAAEDLEAFAAQGFLRRHGYQFHWTNRGYRDFADFLDALTAKRRRDVLRERRRAASHGLELQDLTGTALTERHAAAMERLYGATTERKDAISYLRPGFFSRIFRTMPERILLTTASQGEEIVAAAFNVYKGRNLYGRYWGSTGEVPDLHFELCYYRTVDFAISRGIQLVEAGAQGEHKLQRGFLPQVTASAHLIADRDFVAPIAEFLAEERAAVAVRVAELAVRSPYGSTPEPPA